MKRSSISRGIPSWLKPASWPSLTILLPVMFSVALILADTGPAFANTTVYSNSFETNGETIAPGVSANWNNHSISTTPGIFSHPADKFRGEFSNGTVTLTLTNLPAHSSFNVQFQYFLIRSLDGNFNEDDRGADIFEVSFDSGNVLLYTTFRNAKRSVLYPEHGQSYPNTYNPANPVQNDPRTGASENDTLGYLNTVKNFYQDSVYNINLNSQHTGNLTLHFAARGLQHIGNESWGINDITVTLQESAGPSPISPTKTPFTIPTSTPTEVRPTPIRIPTRTPTPTRTHTQAPSPTALEMSEQLFQLSPRWMNGNEEGFNSEGLLQYLRSSR